MKLAVLLTYYNERGLLTECLATLAAQSVPPDEVWIYDDASRFPATEYLTATPFPVQVVRGESNIGPARGRNRLSRLTQADYIHFHDSDDLFLPGWGERVRTAMALKTPDLILTELRSERDGQFLAESLVGLRELARDADLVRFSLAHAILPAAGTYRREFVLAAGGYREDLWQSEDYEFHIRLALLGAHYCAITEPSVLLRVRSESRSQKYVEVWECRLRGLEILAPQLVKYERALAEAFLDAGVTLHRLGQYRLAHRAFRRSRAGEAFLATQTPAYRWIARWLGVEAAEYVGLVYRLCVPQNLRLLARQES